MTQTLSVNDISTQTVIKLTKSVCEGEVKTLYNAFPKECCEALVKFMREFANK